MALSICLKLGSTPVPGEFAGVGDDHKHVGEIEVLSWNWGMTQSASGHTGSGAGSGTADVKDLYIKKYVDKASPNLLFYCFKGKAFDKAVLTVTKVGGEKTLVESVVLTLSGTVFISSVQTGDALPNDRYTESVTLNFTKANFQYTPQKADNSPDASLAQDIIIT
jgi:type VI secretion system secreted protein Hcp